MFVFGYYYKNNEKKVLYTKEKNCLYFLTDNLDINEWFVSKHALLSYCKENLDKFEPK